MPTLQQLRETPHWSYSSINGYLNVCSLQWAFRYIYKLETESTPVSLLFGSAFHRAAEFLAVEQLDGEYERLEEAQEEFTDAWNLECKAADKLTFEDADEWDRLNELGRKMVEATKSVFPKESLLRGHGPAGSGTH